MDSILAVLIAATEDWDIWDAERPTDQRIVLGQINTALKESLTILHATG